MAPPMPVMPPTRTPLTMTSHYDPTRADAPSRKRMALVAAALAACALAVCGCVDSTALAQAQQEEVDLSRMDEIEIGTFRITLPRAEGSQRGGVVEFKAFGQVPARERKAVAKALALNTPELR